MAKIVSSGKALHSTEYHEKKKKVMLRRWIFSGVIILIIIAIPILILRISGLRVDTVEVAGANVLDSKRLVEVVESRLGENYLWVIPKNSFFLLPRRGIKKTLQQEFPRIKSIGLNLLDTETLVVNIEERTPLALYCKEVVDSTNVSDCYFMDEEGFVFSEAPYFSGDVYLVFSIRMGSEDLLGQNFLTPLEFENLLRFIESVREYGVHTRILEFVPETPSGQGKYVLHFSNGGQIFWYSNDDLTLVESGLKSLLLSDAVGEKEDFLKQVEYIDLTIPNKVYWRLKK